VKHRTLPRFWQHYQQLPKEARELADKNFELLKSNSIRRCISNKWMMLENYGRCALDYNIVPWAGKNQKALSGFG